VNVFGGFLVTRRMLEMFRKKEPKKLTIDKTADKTAKENA
jgi:NAD(P) transhydrogenase subunit alpha